MLSAGVLSDCRCCRHVGLEQSCCDYGATCTPFLDIFNRAGPALGNDWSTFGDRGGPGLVLVSPGVVRIGAPSLNADMARELDADPAWAEVHWDAYSTGSGHGTYGHVVVGSGYNGTLDGWTGVSFSSGEGGLTVPLFMMWVWSNGVATQVAHINVSPEAVGPGLVRITRVDHGDGTWDYVGSKNGTDLITWNDAGGIVHWGPWVGVSLGGAFTQANVPGLTSFETGCAA